jgi:hypothetical protein
MTTESDASSGGHALMWHHQRQQPPESRTPRPIDYERTPTPPTGSGAASPQWIVRQPSDSHNNPNLDLDHEMKQLQGDPDLDQAPTPLAKSPRHGGEEDIELFGPTDPELELEPDANIVPYASGIADDFLDTDQIPFDSTMSDTNTDTPSALAPAADVVPPLRYPPGALPPAYFPLEDLLNNVFGAILTTENKVLVDYFFMTYRRFCKSHQVMKEFLDRLLEVESYAVPKDIKMWAYLK